MPTPILSTSIAAQAQTSILQSRQDRMLNDIKSGQSAHDDARIEKGAKEFESMLLTTWLQQVEQSMATVPGAEDEDEAAGRDQMMSLGIQSLASTLVASGGIGIAGMIARAMHRAADKAAEPVTSLVSAETAKAER